MGIRMKTAYLLLEDGTAYKGYAMGSIQKLKDKNPDHDAYVAALTKHGSVSTKLIMICLGVYLVSMFALSFLIMSVGIGI